MWSSLLPRPACLSVRSVVVQHCPPLSGLAKAHKIRIIDFYFVQSSLNNRINFKKQQKNNNKTTTKRQMDQQGALCRFVWDQLDCLLGPCWLCVRYAHTHTHTHTHIHTHALAHTLCNTIFGIEENTARTTAGTAAAAKVKPKTTLSHTLLQKRVSQSFTKASHTL